MFFVVITQCYFVTITTLIIIINTPSLPYSSTFAKSNKSQHFAFKKFFHLIFFWLSLGYSLRKTFGYLISSCTKQKANHSTSFPGNFSSTSIFRWEKDLGCGWSLL